ncbi:hypothetical protein [Kitasatospora sp. NPDC059571]|uniref:MmyB family transcriptional regulator n=1 Tax=Kitasatospora sp. NPDC059571 TaxID=3346871 RepID=UPI0036C69C55
MPDWDAVADQNVATLRAEVGRDPHDKALSDLIGELSTRGGNAFGQRWARHDVRHHRAGAKRIHHPLVGDLTFTYETTRLTADDGLYLVLCAVRRQPRCRRPRPPRQPERLRTEDLNVRHLTDPWIRAEPGQRRDLRRGPLALPARPHRTQLRSMATSGGESGCGCTSLIAR